MTQKEAILKALKNGQKITPLEALRDFGCFRLAARIYELQREGYNIESELVQVTGAIAGKCTVAQYSLQNGGKQLNLF
jgi:hypothetical protein